MRIIIFFLLLICGFTPGQNTIKVITADRQPVQKAAVLCGGKTIGYTNTAGELNFRTNCKILKVKAAGYYNEDVLTDKHIEVTMSRIEQRLQAIETVVLEDKSDPRALKILDEVVAKYDQNSPKSLPSYSYKSYEKLSVDIDEDSIKQYNQSWNDMVRYMDRFSITKNKVSADSTLSVKEVFANSKLFLWERAQEFLYSEQYGEKINVLDNRVAGLSQPIYQMMALQSNRSRMPREVRPENRNIYRYFLTDSIDIDGRMNYVIRFREVTYRRPRQRERFNGYLYVDVETAGLKKIESNRKIKSDGNTTSIWKYINGKWFLQAESIKMKLTNVNMETKEQRKERKNNPDDDSEPESFRSYGFVNAVYFDHQTPIDAKASDFKGYTYDVKNADGSLLEQYRQIPLSERERNTYNVIDSLGQEYNIEERARNYSALLTGKFRKGMFDFDLGKLIGYNLYEGIRIGAHAKLNDRFHKYISPDAYIAYGFKDRGIKFGAGVDVKTTLDRVSVLRAEYFNDVFVAGRFSENFWDVRMKLNNAGLAMRNDRFYHYEGGRLSYLYDLTRSLTMKLAAQHQNEEILFPYSFRNQGSEFRNTSFFASFHYLPNSKSIMTPTGKFTMDRRMPEFFVNVEQAVEGAGGELNYTRLDALIIHSFPTVLGRTGVRLFGGIMLGDAPIQHNFTMNGLAGNNAFKFNLTSYLGFATMKGGKYYNDKFVGTYLSHRIPWYFKSIGQNVSSLDLIYRAVIGDMRNPEYHQFEFEKLDHLYQEVGIEWNNFLSSWFNLGLFYRVGHYSTDKFSDNFGLQFKLKFLDR